jgi:hypothetical protein
MTIKSNSFQYIDGLAYQFLIIGTSNYGSYEQLVTINVFEYFFIPIVNIG